MESTVVPRDHFRASLLLLLGEVPTHGYDLPVLLAPLGLGATDRGFVYRTLRAMESDGLVASAWDASPTGPARRTYTVTPAGRQWAEAASVTLRDADRHMATWLARYRALRSLRGPQAFPGVSAAAS
ncbi:MAG: helix-turn-helix transcriptional regulator [Acidimicrobiales bacterium]